MGVGADRSHSAQRLSAAPAGRSGSMSSAMPDIVQDVVGRQKEGNGVIHMVLRSRSAPVGFYIRKMLHHSPDHMHVVPEGTHH